MGVGGGYPHPHPLLQDHRDPVVEKQKFDFKRRCVTIRALKRQPQARVFRDVYLCFVCDVMLCYGMYVMICDAMK